MGRIVFGAGCLMLDVNSQNIAKREKENINIRIPQNSEAFLPRIKIRGYKIESRLRLCGGFCLSNEFYSPI